MSGIDMAVSIRLSHREAQRADGQVRHDLRLGRIPQYVSRERSSLNQVVVSPKSSSELRNICEERRSLRQGGTKRKMKKNAAISTNGIVTFSRDAQKIIRNLPLEKQLRLYRISAERIAERLRTDLTGLVIHMDETAPHCHLQFPAVNREGIPLSKTITPSVASELQDIVGSVFSEIGISRGKKKEARIEDGDDLSAIIHRSVKRLHEDLPSEIAREEERLQTVADRRIALEGDLRKAIEDEIKDLPTIPEPETVEIVSGMEGRNVLTKNATIYRAEPVKKFLDSIAPRLAATKLFDEDFVPRRELNDVKHRLAEKERELQAAHEKISALEALVEAARKFIGWAKMAFPGILEKFRQRDSPERSVRVVEDSPVEAINRTP